MPAGGYRLEQAPFSSSEYVELFFDLFETSSDAIFVIRTDGVVFDVNRSALAMWGFERANVIGRSTLDLGLWADPSDRDAFITTVREKGRVRDYSVRFRTRWGEEFTLMLAATLVRLRGEEVILGVGVPPKTPEP